ncbi:MAG: tRNA pseudouridine(55) synthase TruB [Alphaproteobacteria bacterium]|nr:tRNA pseudouridine(55) synthase TruB [Alphaproteobacteria bacterium]
MADRVLHGWLVVDKPLRLSSNWVVQMLRRITRTKVGHAGTLDPWATGVLPIALGEATKTIGYAINLRKCYRFRIRWGIARITDDREGEIVGESASRPNPLEIETVLPSFTGTILQAPPPYSAIKVNGQRAYELARAAKPPLLAPRQVHVATLRLIAVPDRDHADFEALVGKGTYIRALARDLGAALGTFGHVAELRRLSVGRFTDAQAISPDVLVEHRDDLAQSGYVLPIERALDDVPALSLTAEEASRLRCGQRLTRRELGGDSQVDRFEEGTIVAAYHAQALVALAKIENGGVRPSRVLHR